MENNSLNFMEILRLYFVRYTDFRTRSRRSEYWWIVLFTSLVSNILATIFPEAACIWILITFVPTLALTVRRLHDMGKSGWFYLVGLIPLVGTILLLIWLSRDSGPDNQWGPNPKITRNYRTDFDY